MVPVLKVGSLGITSNQDNTLLYTIHKQNDYWKFLNLKKTKCHGIIRLDKNCILLKAVEFISSKIIISCYKIYIHMYVYYSVTVSQFL